MKAIGPLTWNLPIREQPVITFAGSGVFMPSRQSFCLPDRWTLHIYRYHGRLETSGHTFTLAPGTMLLIPPGVANTYTFMERSFHHCAHFRYQRVPLYDPTWAESIPLPAFYQLEDRFSRIERLMEDMVAFDSEDRLRAEVRLWDILMELRDAVPADAAADQPAVQALCRAIERHLADACPVSTLAETCGYSHNHMNRLFRKVTGLTIGAYRHERRMQRAAYLLRHTEEPIKSVAANVGLPDMQHFNKTIRRHFGLSPRAMRRA